MPEHSHEFRMFYSHQFNRVNLKSIQYFAFRDWNFEMAAFKRIYVIYVYILFEHLFAFLMQAAEVDVF